MRIPYYVYDNIAVDSLFLDKVSEAMDRVFLIIPSCEKEEREGIEGLTEEKVLQLLEDAYFSLREEKRRINKFDIMKNFYNPGIYISSRYNEIRRNAEIKIFRDILERVLNKIKTTKSRKVWYEVKLKEEQVFVCDKLSKSYSILYRADENFRNYFNYYMKQFNDDNKR
ncbi:hypothetical protein SJAV_00060 [Sulfurisphaera javensis]|uniref:Uncharacterized protein n=1 Tax=Sulfurisphaera javensis TaxID=2049879 RepID=A0AAT9GMG0_9CREN